jgi:hypothetical protein
MISVTFDYERHANWPFLLHFDVLRGWVNIYNNRYQNEYQMVMNTCRSHPTSTPLHGTFYVMISVTFERQGRANWPFLLDFDVARGWVYIQPISKSIPNGKWIWLKL